MCIAEMNLFHFHNNLVISLKHNKEQHFLLSLEGGERRDATEKLGRFAFIIARCSYWTIVLFHSSLYDSSESIIRYSFESDG